jgi:hypothetical protein
MLTRLDVDKTPMIFAFGSLKVDEIRKTEERALKIYKKCAPLNCFKRTRI